MKLKIMVNCDNAAFEDDLVGELTSILEYAMRELEKGLTTRTLSLASHTKLMDSNGNGVGWMNLDISQQEYKELYERRTK